MKKIALFLMGLVALLPAKADEGMWTMYNLPKAVYEQMKAYGFSLPQESIYGADNAISRSVVLFGGFCTGVCVSPDGLVFTNHHCGFEAIRSHSTVEHDYMRDGFYAKSFKEELPNENLYVSFMVKQDDVTDRLLALGLRKLSYEKQGELIDSLAAVLTEEAKKQDNSLHVEIDAFYEGNKYYATTYQLFPDVRLVFTVPKSMGKFGGETDNWMWPRQTCDYSVFRIYADPKTNKPAEYSENNVPYHPTVWAPVSMNGYKDGDYAMTVGFPGTTRRYLSSYGIREMRDAGNATRVQVRTIKQDIMQRHMRASQAVRIKYDAKYAQSSNYWKNSMGMNKCIDSIGIIKQKRDFENQIRRWQRFTKYLDGQLDFDKMESLYNQRFDLMKVFNYWFETFRGNSELFTRAMNANNEKFIKGPKNKPAKQYVEFQDNSAEWDEALDKEVMAALLKNYRAHVNQESVPSFYKTIDERFGGDYAAYIDYLYKNSVLMQNGKKLYVNKKTVKNDLGVQMGKDLMDFVSAHRQRLSAIAEDIAEQERLLCAAILRMEQELPHYSDANMTMRLSYGQIGGYTMNGEPSGYYTDAQSIVNKMNTADKVIDYAAEPIMKELMSANDYGKYLDKTTGKMQLCFLTSNDITGGNSGSPIFNGKGELIGLAFDGNWDSLSSDIFFDSKLARCIGVDIRYMLYLMDKWGHADRLLEELGVK